MWTGLGATALEGPRPSCCGWGREGGGGRWFLEYISHALYVRACSRGGDAACSSLASFLLSWTWSLSEGLMKERPTFGASPFAKDKVFGASAPSLLDFQESLFCFSGQSCWYFCCVLSDKLHVTLYWPVYILLSKFLTPDSKQWVLISWCLLSSALESYCSALPGQAVLSASISECPVGLHAKHGKKV